MRFVRLKDKEPQWLVKDGTARVGAGIDIEHVAVDEKGAHLTWSKGYRSFIPQDYFQYTYR